MKPRFLFPMALFSLSIGASQLTACDLFVDSKKKKEKKDDDEDEDKDDDKDKDEDEDKDEDAKTVKDDDADADADATDTAATEGAPAKMGDTGEAGAAPTAAPAAPAEVVPAEAEAWGEVEAVAPPVLEEAPATAPTRGDNPAMKRTPATRPPKRPASR